MFNYCFCASNDSVLVITFQTFHPAVICHVNTSGVGFCLHSVQSSARVETMLGFFCDLASVDIRFVVRNA